MNSDLLYIIYVLRKTGCYMCQQRIMRTVRVCDTHGRARLTTQIFRFSVFHHFAHKIPIVYPISILFSPMGSIPLNLSHSIIKIQFPHFKTTYSKSLIISYFPKTLKTPFSFKTQFSPQTSYPKLINQNINSTYVNSSHQHHQLTKKHQNHISPFRPIF